MNIAAMMGASPIYRAVMVEVNRRRVQLGWPMWKLDDAAGIQDGYFAKILWPDSLSGKQASWATLQLVIDAMFPEGFDLEIRPRKGNAFTAADARLKNRVAMAQTDAKTFRDHMRDLSARGGRKAWRRKPRLAPRKQRREAACKAAKARWERVRMANAGATEGLV